MADANSREIELSERAQHAHDELIGRHLQREHRHARVGLERDAGGNVQAECRLAHARAAGDDHQIRRLEPRRHAVEILEPRRHPGNRRLSLDELVDLGERRDD
jgi:hypothetical protein